ncbi:MAG: indolepyruvate/phenylpyruvate decarboxylase [Geminicoccaceae bacterium]
MRLVEALLNAFKDYGASEVFGIPGDFALPFFKVAEESNLLPLHTLSHEPAVGFAADASARMRSRLSVAAVTYGAGAFNLVNAVACAHAEKSPVIVLSGAPGVRETQSGFLLHHQGPKLDSQMRVFEEITCAQACLNDARTAHLEIARVLTTAIEQARPAYLELPRDMVSADVEPVPAFQPSPVNDEAVAACAEQIMDRLGAAQRPVLMVGVEVRRYGLEEKVAKLATTLGIPVVTSFMGRGLLATSDAPLCGTYLGMAGRPEISRLVEDADSLLCLGVILCDTNFGVSAGRLDLRTMIQAADREVVFGHFVYPKVPLGALVDALIERAGPKPRQVTIPTTTYPSGLPADEEPLTPTDIASAVNDLFEREGPMPMAADMGDCLFTAMDIAHTELVAPGYYAGMGFGVPAGLGMQIATGRRVLILVGDGAFQMTGWELGNCRRLGVDPIVLLFNNASWEMLRAFQPESRFNDLDDWHFAETAAALGGDGRRVTTRAELTDALTNAHRTKGRFQLIEAMLPRGALSNTLKQFTESVARLHSP